MPEQVIAHIDIKGERFEIVVNADAALDWKAGRRKDFSGILIAEEIWRDARKGERASSSSLMRAFGTTDVTAIAQQIISKGELPITTARRREMVEEKRRAIIAALAREAIDPRTGAPHTPARLEAALDEAGVRIDPFKPADEQLETVLDGIAQILPIKLARLKLAIKIPPQFAARAYGALKQYIRKEEWLGDGSLAILIEIPAGLHAEFCDKINTLTAGQAVIREVK